jgi:DNA-binding MarR family transcriptional regulator
MTRSDRLTALILEVFRLNGRLLSSGDALVADLGLTSAKWQVLGAIALGSAPQPVSRIAREMGLTRQAVQRSVNELLAAGVVELAPNPHHQRAPLVLLTAAGRALYARAAERQRPWASGLSSGLSEKALGEALDVIRTIRGKLEENGR